MKKTRLPRFRVASHPPRMVFTERDKDILHCVYTFRLITEEQIEHLLFAPDHGQDHPTKTSICRKRLKLLYHNRYLERIPIPTGRGVWAWRPVYSLGRKGAGIIASERAIPLSQLAYWGKANHKDRRSPEVSLLFLDHTLKINDVRIAIALAAAKEGYQVDQWLDDTQLKSQEMKDYVMLTSEHGRSRKVAVIPDAYFVLNLGERHTNFFLELDQATMSNQRWKTRVETYLAYIRSGKYQERYHTHSLRILTVTTTEQRLANLRQTTVSAGGKEFFWFTTLDQATAGKILSEPIWQQANDRTPKPLIY